MATQHDQMMKELITTFPDQFLRLAAPDVAERVHLGEVAFEPEEHYPGSPTGRERRADLVARARSREAADQEAEEAEEVLLHAEIELKFGSEMERRLLRYHRGLSLKYELPVHTMVLYLRGGPDGPREQVYEEQSLGRTVSTLNYHSLRLSRLPAGEFLKRPEPLAWAFATLMRREKGQSRPELGIACVQRIITAPGLSYREQRLLCQCVMAYTARNRDEARKFDKILNQAQDEEIRTMTTSVLEMWQLRGLEEGRRKGRQEGRREGRQEGEATILLRQLIRRFGQLSPGVEERIRTADADQLLDWGDRFVTATTLDEIFDGKPD